MALFYDDHPADIAHRTVTDLAIGAVAVGSPWFTSVLSHVDILATQVTVIGGAVLVLVRVYGLLVDVWRGHSQKTDDESDED